MGTTIQRWDNGAGNSSPGKGNRKTAEAALARGWSE